MRRTSRLLDRRRSSITSDWDPLKSSNGSPKTPSGSNFLTRCVSFIPFFMHLYSAFIDQITFQVEFNHPLPQSKSKDRVNMKSPQFSTLVEDAINFNISCNGLVMKTPPKHRLGSLSKTFQIQDLSSPLFIANIPKNPVKFRSCSSIYLFYFLSSLYYSPFPPSFIIMHSLPRPILSLVDVRTERSQQRSSDQPGPASCAT